MQLPKHKLQVNKASRTAVKPPRSNKHIKSRDRSSLPPSKPTPKTAESMSDEVSEPEVEEKQSVEVVKVIGSTSAKSKPTNMKTKEEKKAIRAARMAANRSRNQYKRRSGGVSQKNGPRAINQQTNF